VKEVVVDAKEMEVRGPIKIMEQVRDGTRTGGRQLPDENKATATTASRRQAVVNGGNGAVAAPITAAAHTTATAHATVAAPITAAAHPTATAAGPNTGSTWTPVAQRPHGPTHRTNKALPH
jgi:hypothetical protein